MRFEHLNSAVRRSKCLAIQELTVSFRPCVVGHLCCHRETEHDQIPAKACQFNFSPSAEYSNLGMEAKHLAKSAICRNALHCHADRTVHDF